MASFKAKFAGQCPICSTQIKAGTAIRRTPYDEWAHARCQPAGDLRNQWVKPKRRNATVNTKHWKEPLGYVRDDA